MHTHRDKLMHTHIHSYIHTYIYTYRSYTHTHTHTTFVHTRTHRNIKYLFYRSKLIHLLQPDNQLTNYWDWHRLFYVPLFFNEDFVKYRIHGRKRSICQATESLNKWHTTSIATGNGRAGIAWAFGELKATKWTRAPASTFPFTVTWTSSLGPSRPYKHWERALSILFLIYLMFFLSFSYVAHDDFNIVLDMYWTCISFWTINPLILKDAIWRVAEFSFNCLCSLLVTSWENFSW